MNKVDFSYNANNYFIQCNNEDKMKDILDKFLSKVEKDKRSLVFIYNGQIINDELTFNKCANSLDRSRNYMNIIVLETQGSNDENTLIKSDYIICPKCKEKAYISMEDFKITISGCNQGHITQNLKLDEFVKTQFIDQSKIKCDNCGTIKSEIDDYKFYTCFRCQQNLCPKCIESHDKSHFITKFEEKQFYCSLHCSKVSCYCSYCKNNLCSECENEHKEHEIINYNDLISNIEDSKNNELNDTREKIYRLKLFINGFIYQLNNLNKNLDTYFEIYNNIISNYDLNKRNYELMKNVISVKKYNTNFMIFITEILNDNNLKNQFNSIINLHSQINFKEQETQNNNTNNEREEEYSISKYNPLDDKYENFDINKLQELQSFTTKNKIELLYVLKDRRILTIQVYYDERGKMLYKLCVYSTKNGFLCDINIDIGKCYKIYQMDDENVILNGPVSKLVKIKKRNIEVICVYDKSLSIEDKLLNQKFLIKRREFKSKEKPKNIFLYLFSTKFIMEIYNYDKGNLLFYKSINKFYLDYRHPSCVQINDNEMVFYVYKRYEENEEKEFLIFYDLISEQKVHSLIVGKGENLYEMFLLNKDNLIIKGYETIILIDVKNRIIKNEFKYDIYPKEFYYINDKIFLYLVDNEISQYELEDSKNIKLKAKIEIPFKKVLKYPGNKLIIHKRDRIYILG